MIDNIEMIELNSESDRESSMEITEMNQNEADIESEAYSAIEMKQIGNSEINYFNNS